MSDENDDLRIAPETVHLLTKGINDAMAELRTFTSETAALRGSGFNDLTLTTMEAGAPGLAEAFDGFCGNWEWGVRGLMQRANLVAERLDLAAGLVWAEDAYWSAKFKYAANGFSPTGNPHLTQEEVAQQSYADIFTPDAPDFSQESFAQAREDIKNTWTGEGPGAGGEG
ncbi:hypothetical protein [Streptomyces chumphonensis]|uniref:hypothetical protein n=1 Tax=Streptomyces chumphonensis TaxID=1214925 RepID=UPI003D72071D